MFAWIILLAVVLILYCLFTALWFIVRDPTFSHRTARAFTARIIISVAIFAILWVMVFTGRLEPGTVFNDISHSFNGQAQDQLVLVEDSGAADAVAAQHDDAAQADTTQADTTHRAVGTTHWTPTVFNDISHSFNGQAQGRCYKDRSIEKDKASWKKVG